MFQYRYLPGTMALICLAIAAFVGFLFLIGPFNAPALVSRYDQQSRRFLSPETVWIRISELQLMQPGDTVTTGLMGGGDPNSTGPDTFILLRKPVLKAKN